MQPTFRFGFRNLTATLCLVLGLITFGSTSSSAQGFRWPEEPKNLKVLPKEAKGAQLGQIMRGFASSLGVRCEHCHVGEGPDLFKFDFSSDQILAKRQARAMIQMVHDLTGDSRAKWNEREST